MSFLGKSSQKIKYIINNIYYIFNYIFSKLLFFDTLAVFLQAF
jgi:hypothetical protein